MSLSIKNPIIIRNTFHSSRTPKFEFGVLLDQKWMVAIELPDLDVTILLYIVLKY